MKAIAQELKFIWILIMPRNIYLRPIYLLLLPVLTHLLNVFLILHIRFETTHERTGCRLSIRKKWKNPAVVFLRGFVLVILFASLFVENGNHN